MEHAAPLVLWELVLGRLARLESWYCERYFGGIMKTWCEVLGHNWVCSGSGISSVEFIWGPAVCSRCNVYDPGTVAV